MSIQFTLNQILHSKLIKNKEKNGYIFLTFWINKINKSEKKI